MEYIIKTVIGLLPMSVINGWIRHLLTLGAGYLLSQGLIDGAAADQIIAALMTIFAIVWSAVNKHTSAPVPVSVTPVVTPAVEVKKEDPPLNEPIAKL